MLEHPAQKVFNSRRAHNVTLNATHDPQLRSWVVSANLPDSDFPIQNLPFAVFRPAKSDEPFRGGVAIGDQILDLLALWSRGLFDEFTQALLAAGSRPTLNHLMSMGPEASSRLRKSLSAILREGHTRAARLHDALIPQSQAEFSLPATIGDYTDFYVSIHHATAVGRQFRPDNPLLPNYRWMPIAYHGRSSSIQVSEHNFTRPIGQRQASGALAPMVGPSRRLDFELEIGVLVGRANAQGSAIPINEAESHAFGLCLINDWSARDIQGWEYQPLGPFLSKNFATTISPWVVTMEALAPFRIPFSRASSDPQPLPYLHDSTRAGAAGLDVELEVSLQTVRMREQGLKPQRLARSNLGHAYWSVAQMITHHTINGCNLRAGDLLGTGTLSGPSQDEAGSLMELTLGGKQPVTVGSAETRTFLEDGDRVVLKAWCERTGHRRIGFGTAVGTVLPARV